MAVLCSLLRGGSAFVGNQHGMLMWSNLFGCMYRGRHVLAGAGQSVRVHDVATAAALRSYAVAAGGYTLAPLRVEGTRDDRLAFAGASASGARCSTHIYE